MTTLQEAPASHLRENPYEIAKAQLRRVGDEFGIDDNLINVLSQCKKAVEVSIPTQMNDGNTKVFTGYRVTHNVARGPSKGGIRYHPDVTLDEVKALVDVDDVEVRAREHPVRRREGRRDRQPEGARTAELERMTRRFTSEIINEIGPEKDIPAPDVGTDSRVMAWIFDTYSMNKGHSVLGVVTGKPLAIGGSLGREEATARGALYCSVARPASGTSTWTARRPPCRASATSAATSRASSCRTAPRSSRSRTLPAASTTRTGSTSRRRSRASARPARSAGCRDRADLERRALLLDVDVLAPCALEQVITESNADRIKASIIVEGANGPITPAADEILEQNGVLILPDILANAGGVVVSYFEWVQGLQEYFWKEDEVNAKLNDIVTRAFNETGRCTSRRACRCASAPTGSRFSGLPKPR